MRWSFIITILVLGTAVKASAQDSIPTKLWKEQASPVTYVRDDVYSNPALKSYQRVNTYSLIAASYRKSQQDLYLQQLGSGAAGLHVHSETYLKPNERTTLWGKAYYTTQTIEQVKFNESADYSIIYPYVMVDSVGGNMKSETYFFSGGIAQSVGVYQWGVNASFKGLQAYRNRDPRPKNISSEITLTLAGSRKIGQHYALGVDVTGVKYNQSNTIQFVSDLGRPLLWHDAGLGVYNKLLAGTRDAAVHNGFMVGGKLNFVPTTRNGFFVTAGVQQYNVGKKLGSVIDEVARTKETKVEADLGYMQERNNTQLIVKAAFESVKRKGIETKFDNKSSQLSLVPVSEDLRYLHEYTIAQVRAVYGKTGGLVDWFVGADVSYDDQSQRYVDPNRTLTYTNIIAGVDLTLRKQCSNILFSLQGEYKQIENQDKNKVWNLDPDKPSIYQMLNSNFEYLTTGGTYFGGSLRADFPVAPKVTGFVQVNGANQTGINKSDYKATMGVLF
ncbi:hypothetical protein LX64_00479 [Chitinophaga skermanii]|uniref:DUF6850 domain-containing protein n=1 Tax=Chitinophaga skermanii TaxID=331697 RepID=A0A327R4K7_9BACT|nr:DUF6850 family outer membrane beta-barrel protein [Chitinophaga skermanii]RAJ10872.1 hypothetical protein LX64_00479 [Chitinophaga skermanii]